MLLDHDIVLLDLLDLLQRMDLLLLMNLCCKICEIVGVGKLYLEFDFNLWSPFGYANTAVIYNLYLIHPAFPP